MVFLSWLFLSWPFLFLPFLLTAFPSGFFLPILVVVLVVFVLVFLPGDEAAGFVSTPARAVFFGRVATVVFARLARRAPAVAGALLLVLVETFFVAAVFDFAVFVLAVFVLAVFVLAVFASSVFACATATRGTFRAALAFARTAE